MADPDRSRSTKLRKALTHAETITNELLRNDVKAEATLTAIEAREERTSARSATTNPR